MGQQFRNYKIVYRRYAGLFFCLCVDANDNELAYLEAIHLFVEILGKLTRFTACVPSSDVPVLHRHIF
jgi:Clathrin adaptor complex small chain